MKLKDYFQSLVSKRKNSVKSTHRSKSSVENPYEVSIYDDPRSRTELLLTRHAELVNSIIQTRSSQTNIDRQSHSPGAAPVQYQSRSFSSTLTMPGYSTEPPSSISSSHQSLYFKTRQRTKIRTNPWIHNGSFHHQTLPATGLIHSESFPVTMANAASHTSSSPLTRTRHSTDHQGESSLTNAHPIEKTRSSAFSSVPSRHRYKKPRKSMIERAHSYRYPSHYHSDHYSVEFEDHLEDASAEQQSNSTTFILPIDRHLSSKSRCTVLNHIEELDHDIERMQNLHFDAHESVRPPSIHEQVDQWIDACLTHPSVPAPPSLPPKVEMMTAFYLTTMPETWIPKNSTNKLLQECPF